MKICSEPNLHVTQQHTKIDYDFHGRLLDQKGLELPVITSNVIGCGISITKEKVNQLP